MSEKPFKWIYRSKVSGLIYDNEDAAGDCEAIPLYRLTSDAVVNRLNEEIAALRAKIAKAREALIRTPVTGNTYADMVAAALKELE